MQTLKEYKTTDGWNVVDTGITKDEWVDLLRNEEVIKPVYFEWILRFYGEKNHESTCYLLGKKYSTNPRSINAYLIHCAQAVQRHLNRFTIQNENVEGDHFMTILMKGKTGGKEGFILRLREELCDAIHDFLINTLLEEFAARVIPIGLTKEKGIDELYKWQIITDCNNKSDDQILNRLIGTNLIDNRFDGAAIKKLLTTDTTEICNCFNTLKGDVDGLQGRYDNFRVVTDRLTKDRWKYIISDERMAGAYLACADPTHFTFYKNDAYNALCNYLCIPIEPARSKLCHFYKLLNEVRPYFNNNSQLVSFFKQETQGYIQSDLLSVQTIVWYMQDYMNSRFKTEKEFTWVPFINELANKLLEYRSKRQELLDIFYGIDRSLTGAYKEEGEDITDITPFTVLGTLAVGNKERRTKFANYYKEIFGLKTAVPTDYTGFPSLNPQRVMFIYGKDKAAHTEPHWDLFEAAMSGKDISDSFDQVMTIKGSRRNISMGLFWINPKTFLSLDSNNEDYLVHYGFPHVPSKNKITYEYYNHLMAEVREKMESGEITEKDFLEFSAAAYANRHDDNEDNNETDNNMEPTYYDSIVSALKEKKNIILQGAPGTGKTYAIPEIVTRLCNENINFSDRKEVMDAYTRLVADKRVVFTTFHQSMDYEDFIEGLKPIVDENENIRYAVEDGIFKHICTEAAKPIIKNNNIDLNSDATIWKVSLKGTYDNDVRTECLNNGHIRIGWDEYGVDYDKSSFEEGGKIILDAFYNKMEEGDIVFSCYTQKQIDAIGIVEGEAEWHDEYPEYKRLRKVRWLVKGIREDITDITGKRMTLGTVYRLNDVSIDNVLEILKKYSAAGQATSEKNTAPYVVVIDEINRGNVSKIFGELITLLEADKRSDGAMPLKVRLPYSKTDFSIPSNLYLIGTMNTADRSLTQFDYAMRRRFRFITLAYNYIELNLPDDKTFEEELFDKVSRLFIKNLDDYKEDPDVKVVPAECFSPEFKPMDLWIGPSYFITDDNDEYSLYNNITYEIIPTLEHYIEDGVFVDEQPVYDVIDELNAVFED